METKDRDKIRAAAENVKGFNELNPNNRKMFVIKADTVIALLDEVKLQTTLAGGWEVDALARKREIVDLQAENTRLRKALENTTKCNTKGCDEVISTSYCSKCRRAWES